MAQLGVVELVVADPVRAKKAKELLAKVEHAFLTAEKKRTEANAVALGLSQTGEPTDGEIRAAFALMDEASREAFQRYIVVQLELRRLLTRAEFDRLARVR